MRMRVLIAKEGGGRRLVAFYTTHNGSNENGFAMNTIIDKVLYYQSRETKFKSHHNFFKGALTGLSALPQVKCAPCALAMERCRCGGRVHSLHTHSGDVQDVCSG